MSDVSKTNELIIEAQQHYSEMNGLNSRAAEVMMELVAALEAATRVPVQGEPNKEREALLWNIEDRLKLLEAGAREPLIRQMAWTEDSTAEVLAIVGELRGWIAALSRATVPDAATRRVTENSVRHVKNLTTEIQNHRESMNDQRREYRRLLDKRDQTIAALRAENKRLRAATDLLEIARRDATRFEDEAVDAMAKRDAALAAVDAIRTLHERGTVQIIAFDHSRTPRETCLHCSQVQEGEQVSPGDAYIWPCPTVAALDGAPEPEVKP